MSDVKETGFRSCPLVTVSYAKIRVLDRHGIPREGNHLRAMVDVQSIERCPLKGSSVRCARRRFPTRDNRPEGLAEGRLWAGARPHWDRIASRTRAIESKKKGAITMCGACRIELPANCVQKSCRLHNAQDGGGVSLVTTAMRGWQSWALISTMKRHSEIQYRVYFE